MDHPIEGVFLWGSGRSIVNLTVHGPGRREEAIWAIVDTAFTGALALANDQIRRLGLQYRGLSEELTMADGRKRRFPMYDAAVKWGDTWRPVRALAMQDGAMIGVALLREHSLWIEIVRGGKVMITRLSRPEAEEGASSP